jgi:hypothetical protein
MTHPAAAVEIKFPSQGTVHDLAGLPVDCTNWVWRLNDPVTRRDALSFKRLRLASENLLLATARFIAYRLQCVSTADVFNTFEALGFLQHS